MPRRAFCSALCAVFCLCQIPALSSAGTRSRAEARYDELINLLRRHNIEYETHELLKEYGAYGTSVFVRCDASQTPKPSIFVLAIPITTVNDTGSEPHAGFESAVRFIEMMRNREKAPPIVVAFLADEWPSPESGTDWAGFTGLLEWLRDADKQLILYAGIVTPPQELTLIPSSNVSAVPSELLASFLDSCKAVGAPGKILTQYPVLYKYGIAPSPPPVRMAAEQEMPLLYIMEEDGDNLSTAEKTTVIDAERLANLYTDWLSQDLYEKAQKEPGSYFIAGSKKTPVFIKEWHIIMIWYFFVLVFYACILCYRHELGLKKTLFFMVFCAGMLFFMIIAFLDVTLLLLGVPALLIVSLGFGLYAFNKKFPFITRKTPVRFTTILIFCLAPALLPFLDFALETARFVKNISTEPSSPYAEEKAALREDKGLLRASLKTAPFFEHSVLTLSIDSQEEAQYYQLFLETQAMGQGSGEPETAIIYTATAPYTINTNGVEFNLGAFPPAAWSLEADVPSAFQGSFIIKAFYEGNRYAEARITAN